MSCSHWATNPRWCRTSRAVADSETMTSFLLSNCRISAKGLYGREPLPRKKRRKRYLFYLKGRCLCNATESHKTRGLQLAFAAAKTVGNISARERSSRTGSRLAFSRSENRHEHSGKARNAQSEASLTAAAIYDPSCEELNSCREFYRRSDRRLAREKRRRCRASTGIFYATATRPRLGVPELIDFLGRPRRFTPVL